MPSWQPNWNDVHWDYGAAREAAAALRRAADLIEGMTADRRHAAAAAQADWQGRHRERFDGELDRMVSQAHDLAHECRLAADRIDRATDRARDEQHHRERERERWRQEKQEEERRERERQQREEEERRERERRP